MVDLNDASPSDNEQKKRRATTRLGFLLHRCVHRLDCCVAFTDAVDPWHREAIFATVSPSNPIVFGLGCAVPYSVHVQLCEPVQS